MATELRWALIVISALIIGGLLIHGLWSVRKKENQDTDNPAANKKTAAAPQPQREEEPQLDEMSFSAVDEDKESAVDQSQSEVVETPSDSAEQQEEAQQEADSQETVPQDFIILHIEMPEGLTMAGSKLLPCVLSLGFKYSDEGFFNRHVESSGNGPVLFRLVNMYNPGTFDIDNMEQFSTGGVSLFMTLPCEGDSMAAFNMLHSAAKKLADEFGASVLDSSREPLTVNTTRAYVEKVREYTV